MLISEELRIGTDSSSNKNEEQAFYSNHSRGCGRDRYGRGRGEIIMMLMHAVQIMMQGLHEDVEEDLHLLMTQETVFIVGKVGIMLVTVIKNKQISEVESYNMVTMHLAVMMIVQKSCLLCNLLLCRMICMMMYGMWTQVHQIT